LPLKVSSPLHTIDLSAFAQSRSYEWQAPQAIARKKYKPKRAFIVVSVLAHILVIALIVLFKPTVTSIVANSQTKPVKSYLIVKSPAKPIAIRHEDNSIADIVPLEEAAEPAQVKSEPEADVIQSDQQPSPIASQSEMTTASSPSNNKPQQKLNNAIQRYQSNLHQAKVQKMAEEAARAYQQAKTSPEINPSPVRTAEERAAALRKIEVDCASAAKQGLAVVTGLLGGTIECRKNNNFQQYIDKHLNKTNVEDDTRK